MTSVDVSEPRARHRRIIQPRSRDYSTSARLKSTDRNYLPGSEGMPPLQFPFGRIIMMKTKLTILAAVAALTFTSSAFAQSFNPDAGTDNVHSFGYQPSAPAEGYGFAGRGLYNYAPTYGFDRQRAPVDGPQWSTSPSISGAMGNIGH
jgi:hypothetical protein